MTLCLYLPSCGLFRFIFQLLLFFGFILFKLRDGFHNDTYEVDRGGANFAAKVSKVEEKGNVIVMFLLMSILIENVLEKIASTAQGTEAGGGDSTDKKTHR